MAECYKAHTNNAVLLTEALDHAVREGTNKLTCFSYNSDKFLNSHNARGLRPHFKNNLLIYFLAPVSVFNPSSREESTCGSMWQSSEKALHPVSFSKVLWFILYKYIFSTREVGIIRRNVLDPWKFWSHDGSRWKVRGSPKSFKLILMKTWMNLWQSLKYL